MQEWVVSVSLSGTNKNCTSNTSSTRRVSRSRGGIGRVRPQRGSFTTIRPSSRPSRKQKWIVCIGTDCRDKVTASSSTGRRTRSRRGSTSSRAERRIVCPKGALEDLTHQIWWVKGANPWSLEDLTHQNWWVNPPREPPRDPVNIFENIPGVPGASAGRT